MTDSNSQQAWEWPESHWRGLVDQARAGRAYRPAQWSEGKRCAVAISFDCDHETNELNDGGKSIARMSWGQYGSRVGVPRILEILARHDVPATFFIPAVSGLLHQEEPRRIIAEGHEVGLHGWIHERNSALPYEIERELMLRSADTLERLTGTRPVGLRTPSWDFSPHTLKIEQELNLRYDSSLMADEDCYELMSNGRETGIVELPVEWIRNDVPYFLMHQPSGSRPHVPPHEVLEIFRREFDAAYDAGAVFQLTLHPHVISARSRIWVLEELIRHAKAKGDCWFATHADVAAFAKKHTA